MKNPWTRGLAEDGRTIEELRQHYTVEKELAQRLRTAGRRERHRLYGLLYQELFARVSHHPQLLRKHGQESSRRVSSQMRRLGKLLTRDRVFMEIGAGDCKLALAVAPHVSRVYAIDVTRRIAANDPLPDNFRFVLSDGTDLGAPDGTVDLAYSDQLIEHLHPDDAREHLAAVHAALRPGGKYLCVTPNRLAGPHDVSKYFDSVATGFHLKEYTSPELLRLFREIGFGRIGFQVNGEICYDTRNLIWSERLLSLLPRAVRVVFFETLNMTGFSSIVLEATKSRSGT